MFCPEGYVTLYDIRKIFNRIIFDYCDLGNNLDIEVFGLSKLRNEIKSEIEEECRSLIHCYQIYSFNMFIIKNEYNFCASLVDGKILSLSSGVFSTIHFDALEYYHDDWDAKKSIMRYYTDFLDIPFVNYNSLCIDARSKKDREIYCKITNEHSLDHSSLMYKYWPERIDPIQESLSKLHGLPICIRVPDEIIDIQFIRNLLINRPISEDEDQTSSRGRPAIVPEVMTAIRELHPDGDYPSRKALAREIQARHGLKASEKTVSRALNEIRGQKSD